MDSEVRLYIERAENEVRLASAIFILSGSNELKEKTGARDEDTFYSGAISHAYYAIFYAAKAILLNKGIKTAPPEIHRATALLTHSATLLQAFHYSPPTSGLFGAKRQYIYKPSKHLFQEEKTKWWTSATTIGAAEKSALKMLT